MITPPAAPRPKLKKRTIALLVAGPLVMATMCLAGAVTLTIRSGVLDQVMDATEDEAAAAQLHKDACLEDLPGGAPGGMNVRPPKVVDCDAENALWIIDDESEGVPLALFELYLRDGTAVRSSEICDTDPARLAYIYAWREDTGGTVTAYCIVRRPIGWHPENQ